jgi:hypothetical protein
MPNEIKFTPEEITEITNLGTKYQQIIFKFGELYMERMEIDAAFKKMSETEKQLRLDYGNIEKEEQSILDKLTTKYGEGSLNLDNGTFIPTQKV